MTTEPAHLAAFCANSTCPVLETGKCLEGLEVGACPHFSRKEGPVELGLSQSAGIGSRAAIELAAAGTLGSSEASRILRRGEARVVAIVGPTAAGKTSLIAGLYDLFQEGNVSGVYFARSETLHAFEQTCHDSRSASRRDTPLTTRTPRGDVRFFHLALQRGPGHDGLQLVLSDRAGEEYRAALDDVSVTTAFVEIQRADSLALLIDGDRLLGLATRHNLQSEATLMIQALLDGGVVDASMRLAVVLTKFDLAAASDQSARVDRDFETLLAKLRSLFGGFFSEIEAFRVAASPQFESTPRGTGVPALLDYWLREPSSRSTPPLRRLLSTRKFAQLRAHEP